MPNTDPYSGSFTIPKQLHVDELSFDGDLERISKPHLEAFKKLSVEPQLAQIQVSAVR